MDTEKDIEILDLGFNFGLYAMTLAGAAGAMQNPKDPYTNKIIELADDRADDLRRSLKRCSLFINDVKSATELGTYSNTMAYLVSKGNILAQEIANEIVAKLGPRQEKIFLLSVKFSQAVGAKQFGHNYSLDISEISKMGSDIGLDRKDISRWINNPTKSIFSELREKLQELVNQMSRPEIIKRDTFHVIIGDNNKLENVNIGNNNQISTNNHDELNRLLQELTRAVEKMIANLPAGEAKRTSRALETIVSESKSENPDRQWWQVSVDGLSKAARNLGKIGEPVLEILAKVTPILLSMSK